MTDQSASPPELRCCVCDTPVFPPYNTLGQRVYCDPHFAAVNKPHPGFWRAGALQILVMGIFAIVVAGFSSLLPDVGDSTLIGLGLLLAITPTALWLWYFYTQDRLEPEPKTRIALVFVVALLLTDFLGRRLVYDWFRVPEWASVDTMTSLLASILIVGFTWQAIQYVAVRFVYASTEFDERMDGIVYGTVAGLGVATLLNFYYILSNGGVALAPGVIHVVTTSLAQASFGGLMGYFMAEAKFTHKPVWYVPLTYGLVAALNGFFTWLIGEISSAGLSVEPWRPLAMGVLVALGAFGVLIYLMGRSTEVTLRRGAPSGR